MSMMPSARAKAAGAPVEVDISKVEPGMLLTVEWRGKPVWIVNRTKEMLDGLPKTRRRFDRSQERTPQQPEYCKNATRSIKPEYLVAVGICTHLGCSPTEIARSRRCRIWVPTGRAVSSAPAMVRVSTSLRACYKNVPAPTNLVIPPHQYLSDTRLLIGVDAKGA